MIFGAYYIWQGAANFIRTGGRGVVQSTEHAQVVSTATAVQITRIATSAAELIRPSATPVPECHDFRVSVPEAVVREDASMNARPVTALRQGTIVCVLAHEGEWYAIDMDDSPRRISLAYMHETIIEAINPTPTPSITPTPSDTFTPLPTVTITPSVEPTSTVTPLPTDTRDPRITNTPGPTRTPTPTITPTPRTYQSA